jgi:hypothetical protein
MMTSVWQWLGRRFSRREMPAEEFRADRMDGAWQPEFQDIAGRERPVPVRGLHMLYR